MLRGKTATNHSLRNLCLLIFLLGVLMPSYVGAQGRPEVIWTRGGARGGPVWSPDGKILAEARGVLIKLWRMPERTLIRSITATASYGPLQMAFAPDGQTLAVAGREAADAYSLKTWRVSDGALLRASTAVGGVVSVSYSRDGQMLAIGEEYGRVRLRRASDFSLIQTLIDTGGGRVNSVPFSPDGQTLASSHSDKNIRIWRISDGALLRTIPTGHQGDDILQIAYSPNGQTLASVADVYSGYSTNARLWRVSDGALLRELVGHVDDVFNVAFAPDGQTLATGGQDKTIKLWRASDGVLLHSVEAEFPAGFSIVSLPLAFSPDGSVLAAGETGLNLRNPSTGEMILRAEAAGAPVYSPDGQMLAAVGDSNTPTVTLWRATDGKRLRILPVAGRKIAFSPDSQTLAVSSLGPSNSVTFWRVSDGALLRTINTGHNIGQNGAILLAFTPDGQTLATMVSTILEERTIKLWRVSDGALLRTINTGTARLLSMAISPDGQMLAASSSDKLVTLWRISDGSLLRTLTDGTQLMYSIAFSHDGQKLAAGGGWYATIRVWSVQFGFLLLSIPMNSQDSSTSVTSITFSPDDQIIAVGLGLQSYASIYQEPPLQFRRASDGVLLRSYNEETSHNPHSITFSPDGRRFAYGRVDGITVVAKNPYGPPSYSVSGMITLEDLVPDASPQPLDLTFRPVNNGTPLLYSLSVGPDGLFTAPGVPNAAYTLHIKGSKWLAKNVAVNTSNGDVSGVTAFLKAGDATDDNIVDVEDLAIFIASFDADPTSDNWNDGQADFNCDHLIDVNDLDILIRNFDFSGDE